MLVCKQPAVRDRETDDSAERRSPAADGSAAPDEGNRDTTNTHGARPAACERRFECGGRPHYCQSNALHLTQAGAAGRLNRLEV